MADQSQGITITFKGNAQSLDDTLKSLSSRLSGFGKSADGAAGGTHKVAVGAAEVEREAKGMTRGIEVAADAMALLSKESAETTARLYEVRSLAMDMRGAFSSWGTAIAGGMAAFAGVAAVGFLSASVKEALAGEQAQAQLNAALKGNKAAIEQVNRAAEDGASQWAKYGVTVGQLKGILAGALGRGVSTNLILQNTSALADLKVALGTDIPGAIDAVTNGPRSAKALSRALNLNKQDAVGLALAMNTAYTANQRMAVALQFVEKSRFKGQGDALANTDTGKMLKFQTSMKDLEETLGQGLVPLLGNFADILNRMVQTVNGALTSFGGLSGLMSQKWVPILGLSLVGLKAVQMTLGFVTKLFRFDFLTGLQQTTQATTQATAATTDYGKQLATIPPDVVTTAVFNSAGAVGVKEPYIANVLSVPKVAATTAVFDAAAAEAGIATEEAQIAAIPRTVTTTSSFTQGALPLIAATAVTIPVAYALQNAFSEASATPIKVPVTYDATNFKEAGGKPIHVPVTYDASRFKEASGKPIHVPVTYSAGNFKEASGKPIHVPVTYDTKHAFREAAAHPLKVPVTYDVTKALHVPTVHITGSVKVQGAVVVHGATAEIIRAAPKAGTTLYIPATATINGQPVLHGVKIIDVKGHITGIVAGTKTWQVPAHAKLTLNQGTIDQYLGTPSKPKNLWVTPKLAPGAHMPNTTTPPTQQPNSGMGNLGAMLAETVLSAVISGAIMSRMMKGGAMPKPSEIMSKLGFSWEKVPASSTTGAAAAGANDFAWIQNPASKGNEMSPAQVDQLFPLAVNPPDKPPTRTPPKVPPVTDRTAGGRDAGGWNTDVWEAAPKGVKPEDFLSLEPKYRIGMPGGPGATDMLGKMMEMQAFITPYFATWAPMQKVYDKHHHLLGLRNPTAKETAQWQAQQVKESQQRWAWLGGVIRGLVYTPLMLVVNGIKGLGTLLGNLPAQLISLIPGVGHGKLATFPSGRWVGKDYETHLTNIMQGPKNIRGYGREFLADSKNQNGSWWYVPTGGKPPAGWHQIQTPHGASGFGASLLGGSAGQQLAAQLAHTVHLTHATHHAAAAAAHHAPAAKGGNTFHAYITINESHNAQATGAEVRKQLAEFVKAL